MDRINQLIKSAEFDAALTIINDLLASDAYNLELLSMKAHVLSKKNNFPEAIEVHNSLINLLPDNADYYAERGLTFHYMGEAKYCLGDLSKAIALEPENGYRYSSRAFIKDYAGDLMGALADYNKAVELDPEDAVSLNNRGLIEEKLGRLHLAQESFAQADTLSGVNLGSPVEPALVSATDQIKSKPKNEKIGLRLVLSTIRNLIRSSAERERFYQFLFKRK